MGEEITAASLRKRLANGEDIHLLDVREAYEHEEGHIEDSILIPVDELTDRTEEIRAWEDEPIVTYCRSGDRSSMAQQLLQSKGFDKVYNLEGGYESWEAMENG